MINDINNLGIQTRTEKIIQALNGFLSSVFHLTGSRFFGLVNKESDYDFIATDTEELRKFLSTLGFVPVDSCYNKDKLITAVYRLLPKRSIYWDEDEQKLVENPKGEIALGDEGFDIQLTSMLESKLLIQKILKDIYPHGLPGDKDVKAKLWGLVAHSLVTVGAIKLPD